MSIIRNMIIGYFFVFITVLAALTAQAHEQDLRKHLESFHRDPQKILNERLPKMDLLGNILEIESPFSPEEIADGTAVAGRVAIREKIGCKVTKEGFKFCLKDYRPGRSVIQNIDTVEELLGDSATPLRSIPALEAQNKHAATLDRIPWSSSYWPIAKGVIANRYADPGNPKSTDWAANLGYYMAVPSGSLGNSGRLSPAEKYDYLVGDHSYTLTRSMWQKVRNYAADNGVIPRWTGICHGWSPASLVYDEPVRSVTIPAYGGGSIKLYPMDIKAMASQLWAEEVDVNFIGGKCKKSNPTRDSIGRVSSPECQDTNPGTWHMAVTNLVGVQNRGFIMDATFDMEVWNHPVYSYDYIYFNPQTLEPTPFWKQALVPVGRYTIDKFKNYRAPGARYVIGVAMNVKYVVEVNPTTTERSQKLAKMVRYVYDLELDEGFNIIGGEWYTNMHPDWLWNTKGTRPVSAGVAELSETWDGQGPIPESWATATRSLSGKRELLSQIVETLVNLSK
jgi:hypothetical protein